MNKISGLALGLAIALAASGAEAHAKLVAADPPMGGVAKAKPSSLSLTFNEEISGKLSGASVKDGAGRAVTSSAMAEGAKTLMVMLKQPLTPGVYSVAWHAVASDDGHRTTGTYKFTVN